MSFNPPAGLKNPHLQTIFSSIGPRRFKVRQSFAAYRRDQQAVILQAHDGIRLTGYLNRAGTQKSSTLVTLIHGWEGSHDSSYMLSMAKMLLDAGIDVFRLNLRDHGDSHHLNRKPFNSTMVAEVISALENQQRRFAYDNHVLGGFSLGGNFACRVAAMGQGRDISLAKVVAFCPVLHAANSNVVLNARQNLVYGQYFVRKWKKSLRKKLEFYPEYGFADELPQLKTLDDMNRELVPRFTPFQNLDRYFDAYAIIGELMDQTICPVYMHFSEDDMIIPAADIKHLADNPNLHITLTRHGGHCGFLMNWQLESWQDHRMLQLVEQA